VVGSIVTTTPVEQQEGLNDLAGNMEEQINAISMAVTNFSATSQELTATMENLSSNAQGIREEINKTDGIVTMIREVSEQTHMLGLNAAIEAARVGDAGRGFNVVAEEIRKLSQDTNRSVKDILQILGEMKSSIVELTNFIDQVTEATQQQAVSAQEINSSINELSMVSVELKKQSEQLVC
jgi:methyl-accepting chemotaxis protein